MALAAIFCLATFAWMVTRIWRSSAALAVASLVLWPVVLLALVRNWGDRDSDIRVPFAAFGIALALSSWAMEAQRYAV